jgi:hypothetical protein
VVAGIDLETHGRSQLPVLNRFDHEGEALGG